MPGFYTNISSQSSILQVAYHPSAPYSTCLLNQHNKTENDARANFYNIYGSTPKLAVNGTDIGNVNFSNSSIYSSQINQMTYISITIEQTLESDGIVSKIKVKKTGTDMAQNFELRAVLAEDTLFYAAPNGEQRHYNVFRKNIANQKISLNAVGDSSQFEVKTPLNTDWISNRMKTIAWVTVDGVKLPLQAESAAFLKSTIENQDSVHLNSFSSNLAATNNELSAKLKLMSAKTFDWSIEKIQLPSTWKLLSVCDNVSCYTYSTGLKNSFLSTGIEKDDFLKLDIEHNKKEGYGFVTVKITEKDAPQNTASIKFSMNIKKSTASISQSIPSNTWHIDDQKIVLDNYTRNDLVSVYDLQGRDMRLVINDEKAIEIRTLNEGIYILRINDRSFKFVK